MSTGIFEETIAASARAAVMRGVAVLDHYFQGESWMHKINLDILDVFSVRTCVLGQLFNGDYTDGREEIFGVADRSSNFWTYIVMVSDCGLTRTGLESYGYGALTVAWRTVIAERRDS